MSKLETLEPDFRAKVEIVLLKTEKETGLKWLCYQGRRTMEYQNELFNQPKDGKDNDRDGKVDEPDEKVTNAKGGESAHNFGLAADCGPIKKGDVWWEAPQWLFSIYARIAEEHGLTAGIHWTKTFGPRGDRYHIEDPRWREKQALWKAGKLTVA